MVKAGFEDSALNEEEFFDTPHHGGMEVTEHFGGIESIEQQLPNRIVDPFESGNSAANEFTWDSRSPEKDIVPKEVIDPFGNGLEVIELDSFKDFVAATGGAKPEAVTQEKWAEMLESLANE